MTFLYPPNGDVKDFQVNHKDGNKLNNDLNNLEWVTPQQNCIHAYSSGLRTDNIRLLLQNIFTGESVYAYSQAEASRILGINPATLCEKMKRLISNGETYRGYVLRYA